MINFIVIFGFPVAFVVGIFLIVYFLVGVPIINYSNDIQAKTIHQNLTLTIVDRYTTRASLFATNYFIVGSQNSTTVARLVGDDIEFIYGKAQAGAELNLKCLKSPLTSYWECDKLIG